MSASPPAPLWQRRAAKFRGAAPSRIEVCPKSTVRPAATVPGATALGAGALGAGAPCGVGGEVEQAFNILGIVGSGSTGSVRHAVRRSDGRHVALKATHCAGDPGLRQLAEDEFELLRGIEHPNIVRALDCIMLPSCVFLVLELFDGQDLFKTVNSSPQKRLTEVSAQPLCAQLVAAVGHLHKRRIIHRDIKPQNVLVARGLSGEQVSRLKLIDFNVARQLGDGATLTPTGTRSYTAPEVIFGEAPGELSDVWAVGLCMHLLLSGRLPQGRDRCLQQQESLQVVAARPVEFLGLSWGDVSLDAKTVLRKCLAIEPSHRVPLLILSGTSEWLRGCRCTGVSASAATAPAPGMQTAALERTKARCCSEPPQQRNIITAAPAVRHPSSPRLGCGMQEGLRLGARSGMAGTTTTSAPAAAVTAVAANTGVEARATVGHIAGVFSGCVSRASTRAGSQSSSGRSHCDSPPPRIVRGG